MPRYMNVEGRTAKFWEIELEGASFTTRAGKIRSDGSSEPGATATKKFETAEEARWAYEAAIFDRLDKGFQLVDREAEAIAEAEALPVPPAKSVRNPDLEKAVFANPDSPDAFLVYGDWLQSKGDPRGELVVVQAALAKEPSAELRQQEADILNKHEDAWFGEVLARMKTRGHAKIAWRYGFLESVILDGVDSDDDASDAYPALMEVAAATFLRELELGILHPSQPSPSYQKVIDKMVERGVPKALRRLAFDIGDYQISWTALGDLSKLYSQLRSLEELSIKVGSMTLGAIELPMLRSLEIVTGGFSKDNMASVARASWPALERLKLSFGDPNYGGDCAITDVEPILSGRTLPKVTVLGLTNATFEDDIALAIAHSKILRQLRVLDLSQGTMTDSGARVILERINAFRHLERLVLSENYISEETCAALESAFGERVVLGEQGESDDDDFEDRYVQISE